MACWRGRSLGFLSSMSIYNQQEKKRRKDDINQRCLHFDRWGNKRVTNLATTVRGTSLGLVDPVVVPFLSDSPDIVRVLEARVADTDDGSCRACFTASIFSD